MTTAGTGAAIDLGFNLDEAPEAEVAPVRPEDPNRKKKAVIIIDQVDGKPNYEFVGINGKGYQIMRGVEVTVPWEVVHGLENAVATRVIQTTHPVTGLVETTLQDYAAIPYRVVRWI